MESPLRQYRADNGLKLRHLAERLNLSIVQVSRLERGKRPITPEMAVAIETATNKAVPRWKLRPDFWSEPASSEAA